MYCASWAAWDLHRGSAFLYFICRDIMVVFEPVFCINFITIYDLNGIVNVRKVVERFFPVGSWDGHTALYFLKVYLFNWQ